MSEPKPELINELYREEIADARRASAEEKMRLGGDLFDDTCERMRYGIRAQFPDAGDEQVERILRERLDIARRLEDGQ